MSEKSNQNSSGFLSKSIKLAFQLAGVLAVGCIIVAGVLAWRLASGPVSIAPLSPYFESALSSRKGTYMVRVDDTTLKWVGGNRAVDLILRGTRILSPEGQMFVQVPELAISLSPSALLRGELAPKSLYVSGASITVTRNIDGRLGIELPRGKRSSEGLVRQLLAEVVRTSGEETALIELRRLEIDNAAVSVDDRQMGITWTAPKSSITLNRSKTGIVGWAQFELLLKEQRATITLNGNFDAAREELSLAFGFTDISPVQIAGLSKKFETLRYFDAPVTGSVAIRFAANGVTDTVDFDLETDTGRLFVPNPFGTEAAIQSARFKGSFDHSRSVLDIENASIDLGAGGTLHLPRPVGHGLPVRGISVSAKYWLGAETFQLEKFVADLAGPRVEARGFVQEIAGEKSFDLKATAYDFEMNNLGNYWPADIGSVARRWILENLSDGTTPQARAAISGRWSDSNGLSLDTFIGDMEIQDLTVNYLPPMPPAKNVSGSAKFNKRTFEVNLKSGSLPGMSLNSGSLAFTGLDQHDQFLDMDLNVNGSFKSALELINSEPLGFAKAVNLLPDDVTGQGMARVKLGFLVERATSAEDVRVSATASLEDISIPNIGLGHSLSAGNLSLNADNNGLIVNGTANIAKVPVALSWQEKFQRDFKDKTQISLTADLSAEQFRSVTGLGPMPFGPVFVGGNLGVGLLVKMNEERAGRFVLDLNLLEADLAIPQFDWQKSAKVKSVAKILGEFEVNQLTRINSFDLAGGGVKVTGDAEFSKNAVEAVNIQKFLLGGSDVSGFVGRREGGWSVSVRGPRLDISALLEHEDEAAQTVEPGPDLSVKLEVGRLEISDGNYLRNVSGRLKNNGRVWTELEAIATVAGGKSLVINLSPVGGKRLLSIGAEDAGAVLKNLGYYENIVGGKLAIKAEYADMTQDSIVTGQALIEDFRLVDAPVLARLLSIASITGIPGELAGAGLSFQQFTIPFVHEDGLIRINDAKAGGISLGITANGTIDTELGTLDIKGSLAPLDKINSLLGNIPLLGVFFSGGEKGGGVFAAEYSMSGPFDDPEISTNPLSAFTPGIFRKIFEAFPNRATAKDRGGVKKLGTLK